MTRITNACVEQKDVDVLRPWSQLLQDLTAVDAWIVHRAIEILDEQVIKHGPRLSSPQDVKDYLRLQLINEQREVFAVVFMDTQSRVIAYEPLFFGTVHQTSVYPRVIVQRAMSLNAASMILAHNHPSGSTKPSDADKQLTNRLKSLLESIDVRVLDHFIIGEDGTFSFAEHGLLF
ncbi:MAG: DNA repair protein RadC [Herminiimonas sp.]|uniref:JAB domain-containing protein n=1 Tax=Herminiimonas sp. TaxID=1926289 RepID=UPI002718CCA7|nr:DNA repair protein RadC [Herminiimonas sp.]MDO9420325.1 DNA repair protein RadC [Herminiimonas sp.]